MGGWPDTYPTGSPICHGAISLGLAGIPGCLPPIASHPALSGSQSWPSR